MKARFPDHLRLPLDFEPARLAIDMANFRKACGTTISSIKITTATGASSRCAVRAAQGQAA
jgi:hypothetical protein